MRIAFFGASVTQQGGLSSYITYFKELTQKDGYIVGQFGYGSMHLYDAGICFIDEVIKFRPNVCFLEWFTSGAVEEKDGLYDYLNTLIYRFNTVNCKLILLILPRLDDKGERKLMAEKSTKYFDLYGIPSINLIDSFNNIKDLLRDNVHTNPIGASQYSVKILEEFKLIKDELKVVSKLPLENKYCKIKILPLDIKVKEFIKFILSGEIMGFYMNIGPYTGKINIIDDKGKVREYVLQDEWCYFERPTMKIDIKSINKEEKEEFKIEVLQKDNINRTKIKVQLDWDNITKYLDIIKIFYIGELEIGEYV